MSQTTSESQSGGQSILVMLGVVALLVVGLGILGLMTGTLDGQADRPRVFRQSGQMHIWWDGLPTDVEQTAVETGPTSNIHPRDYVGPESCRECHADKYTAWSGHAHRWMNALAEEATVRGDFSGDARVSYLGGNISFERDHEGKYLMRLDRGSVQRIYECTQTIGSRFFQYYVGKQLTGPEPLDHSVYHIDHVMAFGYWLDREQWVPVVHVGPEMPDGQRPDPYNPPFGSRFVSEYATNCNYCHTTFPLAEMFVRNTALIGRHAPTDMHWSLTSYLREERPELELPTAETASATFEELERLFYQLRDVEAPEHAVTLGISCEACHLGAQEHVRNPKILPQFFPESPHLLVESDDPIHGGRTHSNVNWACARCHAGDRPMFAGEISTWNSTEFSDASRGSCYSQLRCIDCHDPHESIGKKWSRSADQDDASCLRCHDQFEPAAARQQHTHHPIGSEGSRCMNCHMPRMNEGLQDVVRTHTIFSPTKREPLEANHPNACNLCHTDKPIDWTLSHLKQWYGAEYSESQIARNYADRNQPTALNWLASTNESVRLVGSDALLRARESSALPQLIRALDDPYLLNRQFAMKGLEEWFNVKLSDYDYYFYGSPGERRAPLMRIRAALMSKERTN